MANTKVTQHVIADDAITTSMITDGNVTVAKLPSTVDLSSKTLTLPAVAIPSASTATTQSQSDGSTKVATTAYVDTAVSNLIDSAPGTMNTLNEIAAALNDDANFNTTVTNSIAAKLPLAGGTMTGDIAHASNFTIDAGGNIDLDADGSHIIFSDGGTEFGRISHESTNLALYSLQGNGDIKFAGVPSGGSSFYALTLNMSASGFATFNSGGSFGGTGALKIPVGTTGQRPTAATGQIRFNSTDGKLEVYTGSAWSAVGSGGVGNHNLDTFTGDGSTTAFTLTVTPSDEDSLTVFIDGAYQEKGDYSLSGTTLTLDTAPLSGEKVSVHTITGTIHDGTAALNQQFTGDGSTTAFTLNADPGSENNTQVFINGVYQQKTDYTVSGTTLTFDTAPTNGDIIEVNSFTVTNLGNSDQVTEGSSNLYHTSARAISAISSGNLTGLTVDTNTLSVDATNDKVGINTTSPSRTLSVVDSSSSSAIEIKNNSGQLALFNYYGTGHLDIGNSASAGNITIYTNNGNANLIMNENGNLYLTGGNDRRIKLSDSGIAGESDSNNTVHIRGEDDTLKLNAAGNGHTIFEENGTEHLRIKSGGAVGIGTSNPDEHVTIDGQTDVRAELNLRSQTLGNTYNGGTIRFKGYHSNQASDGSRTWFEIRGQKENNTQGSVTGRVEMYINPGNNSMTEVMKIESNGDMYTNDGTVHSLASDSRVKSDVADLTDGLSIVSQLRPVTYKYNTKSEFYNPIDETTTRYGFIADEVKTVAPQYIKEGEGKIDGVDVDDFKTLSQTKMIPMLVKAIQELKTENDNLKARIETLEG